MLRPRARYWGDLLAAWLAATIFSGLPSTVYALVRHEDVSEPMRAAGAMLISPGSSLLELFEAAAIVHATISLFWAALLVRLLPRRRVVLGSLMASIAIGVFDLRVVAPFMFPEVARLDFWPQMADHAMWGLCVGAALTWREQKHAR